MSTDVISRRINAPPSPLGWSGLRPPRGNADLAAGAPGILAGGLYIFGGLLLFELACVQRLYGDIGRTNSAHLDTRIHVRFCLQRRYL